MPDQAGKFKDYGSDLDFDKNYSAPPQDIVEKTLFTAKCRILESWR
jgi:hypothetical protein